MSGKYNEYQAKYLAKLLYSSGGDGVEKISGVLMDAKVDLNPHQIEAAIFALDNPLSSGAILADEVGLGKTIEAGLIISQKWAEGKRKILIVTPVALKVQWQNELADKFYLESKILKTIDDFCIDHYNSADETIYICSYNFAYNNASFFENTHLDLVVFDEAHKLRNVYKDGNIVAPTLKAAFKNTYKLLLTATPLQNSLLELYGLVSFVDDNIFGDLESFKNNYVYNASERSYAELSERVKNISVRTLRRQVAEYIKYTSRFSLTQSFTPLPPEQELYNQLTEFLYFSKFKFKNAPHNLIAMTLLKQLSSSTSAFLSTLKKLKESSSLIGENTAELDGLITLATNIKQSAKSDALVKGIKNGFAKLKELGANQKAVIFTESLKTQEYLKAVLQENTAELDIKNNEILVINGSSNDRDGIITDFKNKCKILIATEVGSEGLNLQFCSLVINYDLPWNPQRIEQRIGRCHRYGQKFDVVVINFLNENNQADKRVYELLSNKFCLFSGMFGASDTILGILENVDFEKQVSDIYANCRTDVQINSAFDSLKKTLDEKIKAQLKDTKRQIFERLDSEVAQKLKLNNDSAQQLINKKENILWELTKCKLGNSAHFFDGNDYSFMLQKQPFKGGHNAKYFKLCIYRMEKSESLATRYRLNCPLAREILFDIIYRDAQYSARIRYDLSQNEKVTVLLPLRGKSGYLAFYDITAEGEYFITQSILAGMTSSGEMLTEQQCEKMIMLQPSAIHNSLVETDDNGKVLQVREQVSAEERERAEIAFKALLPDYKARIDKQFNKLFDKKATSLDKCADDKKQNLERKLKEFDHKISDLKAKAKNETQFSEKIKLLNKVKELELERSEKRIKIYEAQDQISMERDSLIEEIKQKLSHNYKGKIDQIIKWEII